MVLQLEQQSAAVVFLGQFNPAIFSPGWLALQGVISHEAMLAADLEVIHPEFAKFTVGSFIVEVMSTRASFLTKAEPFVELFDTVVTLFGDSLPHTPISKMGINYEAHFATKSSAQRIALGRALAPTEPWGAFGKELAAAPKTNPGGMTQLVMQLNQIDGRQGYRRVQVEPDATGDAFRGVKVHVNDHYEVELSTKGAVAIVEVLKENFEPSITRSRDLVRELGDFALGLAK